MLDYTNTYAIWFERMLDPQNMVTTYKAYWLKGILQEVIEAPPSLTEPYQINFSRLIHRMIAKAWYPVLQYKLNFGVIDQLPTVVKHIANTYALPADCSKKHLLNWLSDNQGTGSHKADKVLRLRIKELSKVVPYRLIVPFFSDQIKGIKNQDKSNHIHKLTSTSTTSTLTFPPIYSITPDRNAIILNPDWIDYIQQNQAVLLGWLNHKLTGYLQHKNRSVPNIIEKLEPLTTPNLSLARTYWRDAIILLNQKDLYTQLPLTDQHFQQHGSLSIDHFIPWSFVLHDELWNLHPTFKNINSAKGNRLPNLNKTLETYCHLQYDAFNIMRTIKHHRKALEDYLNLGGSLNHTAILNPTEKVDRALFINTLKNTLQPLYQIAYNQGFEIWDGYKIQTNNLYHAMQAAENIHQ